MKKAIFGVVLLAACGVSAQEQSALASRTNAAAKFNETSAAQVSLLNVDTNTTSAPIANVSLASANATGASAAEPARPPALPAAPEPAPNPRYIFGDRDDYRWQLGVGFEYFRFQSNVFDANLFGVTTTVSYYTNGWFGVEGDIITGFSTSTYFGNQDHAKIFGGAGGVRVGSRRAKWEPWGHGLVGGAHLQPQTAAGSRTGLMAIVGGGVDYRVQARLSLRFEGDWVYTTFFSQSQNSFQSIAAVVLHF